MQQAKFSIGKAQLEFLSNFNLYGFKDKSSLVRKAIEHYKKELEIQKLKRSAELYAEIYNNDADLQQLTNSALAEWPE
jgi:hypothetical protein